MPTATTEYLSELDGLQHRLDSWPYIRMERRTDCVVLRVRDLVVGTLNPVSGAVSVTVPRDAASRGTAHGMSVRVTDGETRAAAEALLRWRVEIERFGPQLRASSP